MKSERQPPKLRSRPTVHDVRPQQKIKSSFLTGNNAKKWSTSTRGARFWTSGSAAIDALKTGSVFEGVIEGESRQGS